MDKDDDEDDDEDDEDDDTLLPNPKDDKDASDVLESTLEIARKYYTELRLKILEIEMSTKAGTVKVHMEDKP